MSLLTIMMFLLFLVFSPANSAEQQRFLEQPWDVTVVAGDKITLPCVVASKKGLLQWTKDGFGLGLLRELPGYPRYRMVGDEDDGEWGLEISPVESSDDGVYQCQVSSQADDPAIRSGEARLSVMSPPGPPLILQGAELMISQGEDLELTCVSRGGRPAGEIIWKSAESGEEILSNTKSETVKIAQTKTFQTTSVLRVRGSSGDDQQKILCSVSNHLLATPLTADVTLLPKFQPRVVVVADKKVLSVGETFTAHCEASAFPQSVEYSWYLDNKLLPEEKQEKIILPGVKQEQDKAVLECRASNSVGTGAGSVAIHIKYGPVMTVQPSSLTVREGTSAKLSCGGAGNPPPSYRWFRLGQGERQEVGRGTDLVVVGSSHTRGHYQCEVRVGDTAVLSSPALLSLYTRPVIQTDQTHYGEAGQDITLTCSVDSGLDDNTISWDVEGLPVSPDNVKYEVRVSRGPQYVSQLTILQAELEDFVSYGCEATNQLGYDYVRIKLLQEEQTRLVDEEFWYVIIAVLSVLIILALLGFCFILGRRREKSNAELIKTANEREKIKENEYVKDFPSSAKMKGPEPDLIPSSAKNTRNLPKNLLSPQEEFTEDEDDMTDYKICPIEDEESHIYAKLTRPLPYMLQRFEQQPLCSNNASLSSLESGGSQQLSSLDSANSEFRRKNTPQTGMTYPAKRPFVLKNLYTRPDSYELTHQINAIEDSEEEDDQYVTLLPAQQNLPV